MMAKRKQKSITNLNSFNMVAISITFTNDQIKALPSVFLEVIPAPGVGKANIVFFTLFKWHIDTGYPNSDVNTILGVSYNGQMQLADASVYTNIPSLAVDGLAVLSNQAYAYLTGDYAGYLSSYYQDLSHYENKPLMIGAMNNSGDFLVGHANNTLKVTVYYVVVDL